MMTRAVALLALTLAACGAAPPPPAPTAGQVARKSIDVAMTAYATCVYGQAKQLAAPAKLPADIVDAAARACAPAKAALVAKVATFQKIGSPTSTAAYTDAVADQSVAAMEDDLRAEATTMAIDRQNQMSKN